MAMATNPQDTRTPRGSPNRGFASIDPERQREGAPPGSRAPQEPGSPGGPPAGDTSHDSQVRQRQDGSREGTRA
jgi:hypothetical protein